MGKPRGFIDIPRVEPGYRDCGERIRDYKEVERRLSEKEIEAQASRCMDCGIPFCHGCGCPLANVIPEWNDLVSKGFWEEALDLLLATNNFPEFTGRVCPALCEASCTVGLNAEPVSIRQIELMLIERAFEKGKIAPRPPAVRTGRTVAVVGSGPAGLAIADTLNKLGHSVTVYERELSVGGLLRYGIPDFKLDKDTVRRRVDLMAAEGVVFETGVNVGVDISGEYLRRRFDAICLAVGAKAPRDLPIPGRDLGGIHMAMDFLSQQNKRLAGEPLPGPEITARGKRVLVIGGGDTGSDCVGTSIRQGAIAVTQIEIMPKPPETRHPGTPWPLWPYQLRTSSSHKEGCERIWDVASKRFEGENGMVKRVHAVKVAWDEGPGGRPVNMRELPGSEFTIPADLVLLAMGFTGPEKGGVLAQLGIPLDARGNVAADPSGMTSTPGVFAAGDVVSGASLVVRAMAAGRALARNVDKYLKAKAS